MEKRHGDRSGRAIVQRYHGSGHGGSANNRLAFFLLSIIIYTMDDKKKFWDDLFAGGQTYRPLKDEDLEEILRQYSDMSGLQPKVIADIGAGTGDVTVVLAKRGFNVTAFDISSVALDSASIKAKEAGVDIYTEEADINASDFGDTYQEAFDLIFLKLAIAFADNGADVIQRVHSMLRPKGAVVIITPVLVLGGEYSERQKGISVSRKELEGILENNFSKFKIVSEQGEPIWPLVTYLCLA